jgi:hypothetical protein
VTGRPLDAVTRALESLLGRCAGLVPPGRRGWVEAVRAEAGEVPPGMARLGWMAGGLWLVAREAGMVRRIGYGLGIAAVAAVSALAVRYLWSAAHAGRDDGWDKARMLLLVALLAGLPWVARRRGVFGPVGPGIAARAVRAGGSAALVALVLDFARVEHFPVPSLNGPWNPPAGPWNWAQEAAAVVLIAACLAGVLIVTARRPQVHPALVAWCAVAAGLVLFFTVAPVQVLIAAYAAGLLAVTSRRSPVTPATLALSAGIGAAGGLLVVALWGPSRSSPAPPLHPKTGVLLLFMLLIVTIAVGTGLAGLAAHRANGTDDPVAVKARARQFLAAGPLTAASAALMLPLFRASHAVHFAAVCPAAQRAHCTAAPAVWVIFLVAGPLIGLAMGTCLGSATTTAQPPRRPPPEPPSEPPEPQPDGARSGGAGVFVKI